jgi:hypothetical protein
VPDDSIEDGTNSGTAENAGGSQEGSLEDAAGETDDRTSIDDESQGEDQIAGDAATSTDDPTPLDDPTASTDDVSAVDDDGSSPDAGEPSGADAGGASPSTPECTSQTGDYCSELPRFTGTQVVDGVGDEFCGIPAMSGRVSELPSIHADYADTSLPTSYELRAAWSDDAFVAHVRVIDEAIETDTSSELWRGDTVQLYIAPSSELTGNYGDDQDGTARHILVSPPDADNPDGRAVFLASNTEYTDVPEGSFASRLVQGGYEVEVRLQWADNAEPRVSGASFGFNFSMSVLDSDAIVEPELEGWLSHDDALEQCDHPWCDDRHWCQPRLE